LTVNGTHVIRERGNKSGNRRGQILYWGGFSAGGTSILTLKIGGNYMLGRFEGVSIPGL
jgi:hypothetical protein